MYEGCLFFSHMDVLSVAEVKLKITISKSYFFTKIWFKCFQCNNFCKFLSLKCIRILIDI